MYDMHKRHMYVHIPEPELVEERAELICARKAEPDRGVERGLSSVPESCRLAGGRLSCGTVRNCEATCTICISASTNTRTHANTHNTYKRNKI